MKLYKKIDLYFNGDYIYSTNQSKTCKDAVLSYIEQAKLGKHSSSGATFLQEYILKNVKYLKAKYATK